MAVRYFFQYLLQNASFYLVVVLKDNLSNGMNLLIAYQRLEIYLYNLICHAS